MILYETFKLGRIGIACDLSVSKLPISLSIIVGADSCTVRVLQLCSGIVEVAEQSFPSCHMFVVERTAKLCRFLFDVNFFSIENFVHISQPCALTDTTNCFIRRIHVKKKQHSCPKTVSPVILKTIPLL